MMLLGWELSCSEVVMMLLGWNSAGAHRETWLVLAYAEAATRERTAHHRWEAGCIKHRTDLCLLSTLAEIQVLE